MPLSLLERDTRRTSKNWIDAAVFAALVVVSLFSGNTTWLDGMASCPPPSCHLHGAGEFITGPGLGDIATAVALAVVGALLAAGMSFAAFLVAARRSPGRVITRTGQARPIAGIRLIVLLMIVVAAIGGIGAVGRRADISDFPLSYFVEEYLSFHFSHCLPHQLPAAIGFHATLLAVGLVAGWTTRLQRRRFAVLAIAMLGAGSGAALARSWLSSVRSPARAACVYFVATEYPGCSMEAIRRVFIWNRSGFAVREAVWLAGPDPSANGARLEWREPFLFRSGANLEFGNDSTRDLDSCKHPSNAPLRNVKRIDAVSLIRADDARVPCVDAGALLESW